MTFAMFYHCIRYNLKKIYINSPPPDVCPYIPINRLYNYEVEFLHAQYFLSQLAVDKIRMIFFDHNGHNHPIPRTLVNYTHVVDIVHFYYTVDHHNDDWDRVFDIYVVSFLDHSLMR